VFRKSATEFRNKQGNVLNATADQGGSGCDRS